MLNVACGKNRIKKLRKILGVILVIAILGICPGINEIFKTHINTVFAVSNKLQTSANQSGDNPFSVELRSNSSNSTVKQVYKEKEILANKTVSTKKKMSAFENISWLVARSLLPTVAVMAFSAAIACPLAWVIIGSIIVGAATAGVVTFGYEMRKNHFRAKGKKQGMDKILRQVSIMAAINGAMAPFQLATAGLVSAVGPATIKSVVSAGAKTFAVQAASKAVIYGSKGAVMNAWYKHYYNYDKREKYHKYRIA